MSFDLHIVTPCARPANLPRIAESIASSDVPEDVRLKWLVVLDDRFEIPPLALTDADVITCAGAAGVAGHAQRNFALDAIASGWIVFVDDDNLLHPNLPRLLSRTIVAKPTSRFVVFDQDLGDGIRRAAPESVRVGAIDSAQFAFERAFAADERFDVYAYSADGIFAWRLFKKAPKQFAFVNETAALYNALNLGRFGEPPAGQQSKGPLPDTHNTGSLHFHRTFATDDLIRLGSNVGGHRLYLSPGAVMRSPVVPGPQRLRGRAWLHSSSRGKARVQITLNGDPLVDVQLRFRPFLRFLGGRRFDVPFDAPDGAEIEIRVTGEGTVVLAI
jgi:hypothetical protein